MLASSRLISVLNTPYRWSTCLLISFTLVVAAPGCTGPGSGESGEGTFEPESPPSYRTDGLRLATLNTEFMFDGIGKDGGATFPHKGDPAKAHDHREGIGQIIRMLDADLVMLQEVENREVVEALARESLNDMNYKVHFVEGRDTFTGQDVALLSRVPVDTVGRTDARAQVGSTSDDYGVSKNLFARLQLGETPTTLIGLHFLARPTDTSRKPRREAQATVIARLAAREHDQGRAVAILGDFNDYDNVTADLNDNRPITQVLARIKEAGDGPDDDLRNVMAEVPQQERFTAHWDQDEDEIVAVDELSALDHVLLSSRLYQQIREVTFVQAHDPLSVTDHFPVVVTLAPAGGSYN